MEATVALTSEAVVDLSCGEAFELFGNRDAPGWLFRAHCHRVAPGFAVSIDLPSAPDVSVLGRFRKVVPGRLVVIEHDQPWHGQIRLQYDVIGYRRTRVRVRADVPASGALWLAQNRGARFALPAPTGAHRIGILTSKSGSGAIYSSAAEYTAELAAEQVNLDGGLAGRSVEVLVADDATDHTTARTDTRRLIEAGCRAIFACTTSASFAAAVEAASADDVLMVHPVINEGGMQAEKVVRFGERPIRQLGGLVEAVDAEADGGRWFLVGQDYIWSYGANKAARRVVEGTGGQIVGRHSTPLGTKDFSEVLQSIQHTGADVVMSSLVGADEVAFQQQAFDAGLHLNSQRVSLVMDECTLEHVGERAGHGIWTALNYFDGAVEDRIGLQEAYRQRHGQWAPPLSSLSVSMYEAVRQYLEIVAMQPAASAADVARAWRGRKTAAISIGERDLRGKGVLLARVGHGSLRVLDRIP